MNRRPTRQRSLLSLVIALALTVLFAACASRQPTVETIPAQYDTVNTADTVRFARETPSTEIPAESEEPAEPGDGDESRPGDQGESGPGESGASGDGQGSGTSDGYIGGIVLSPGPGSDGAEMSREGVTGETQGGGSGVGVDVSPFTAPGDSTAADSSLIQLDGPPVMRGFIPPSQLPDSLLAQQARLAIPMPDSAAADSLQSEMPDTLAADSLATPDRAESDLDTSIAYSAEDIFFVVPERRTILTGNATVDYKGMILRAHRIEVDWNRDTMTATPALDTVYTDTTNTEIDTVMYVGMPTFSDGGEELEGELLKVNMKTRQGYIEHGSTEYGIGIYHGTQIQKVSDDVLYVKDGYFTTSYENPPDYKFTGNEMKMIVGDKVVGKPVVLRFGEVPVFAVPFGVFSIERGRRSGILIPSYGQSGDRGRNLQDFGYYWAASDYWDLETKLDFYEKTGIMLESTLVYKDRYRYSGTLSGSIDNSNTGQNGWDLRMIHRQEFDKNTRLNVDATFVSRSTYYNNYSNDALTRVNQQIRSNATFSKNWPTQGNSLTMNLNHAQDLSDQSNNQTLPNVSYNHGRIYFFPSEQEKKKSDKGLLYEPPQPRLAPGERLSQRDDNEEKWFNSISMSYNNRFQNKRDEDRNSEDELEETWRSGFEHNLRFSAPQKVAKYFNLNPSISYNEDWLLERRAWYIDGNGTPQSAQERGFYQRRTFNASLNTTTKLYGYFPINRWTVNTIRHVVTPTISMSFRPDFSDPEFGYYQQLQRTLALPEVDADGDTTYVDSTFSYERDRYTGSLLGGTSRGRQLALNFSLNNLFQMKRILLDQEGEEIEAKTDLFTYNLSTSYNFAADSLKFGDLSASFRANPISGKNRLGPLERLSIDIQTRHSFYQYDLEANRRVDKFYWESDDFSWTNPVRMTSFSTSSQFAIAGKSPFAQRAVREEAPVDTTSDPLSTEEIRERVDRFGSTRERFGQGASSGTPWRFTGNIRYRLSMENPMDPNETFSVGGTLSLRLTERWQFSYSTQLDLISKQVVSSSLNVTRDLKSWEGSFRWSPQGIGQGFYLRIGIKAPMLQDVQLEQRRGRTPLSNF